MDSSYSNYMLGGMISLLLYFPYDVHIDYFNIYVFKLCIADTIIYEISGRALLES